MQETSFNRAPMTLGQKMWQIHWILILLLCVVASVGFVMLYSAASGKLDPWASRQMVRFGVGLVLLVIVAVTDIRLWFRYAYLFYGGALLLLAAVEVAGFIGMGARRWIDLGIISLQPSELMKLALVLALARYFHSRTIEEIGNPLYLLLPGAMIAAPAALVLRQPDLGTATMLTMAAAAIFFVAGVRIWKFIVVAIVGGACVPIAWQFLHDYQRQRVLTFINPESDPLGSGYHIIQSKIALGSGGLFGKGFLEGTQSHLSFLPEKQTDFIFTMLAEEFGMVGGVTLLTLYVLLFAYGIAISVRSRSQFGRLAGMGLTTIFFLYVFINMAMVMGLIPVVGVPLPLIGFGILMSIYVHRDVNIGRYGDDDGA
jgi:rod shape determining protein RodA